MTISDKEWNALKLIASCGGHNDAWSWINDPKTKECFDALRGLIKRYEQNSGKPE
jgi:hypothetical protein